MGFEVPPTRVVRSRARWTALPVVLIAIGVVGFAIVSKPAPDRTGHEIGASLPAPVPSSRTQANGTAAARTGGAPAETPFRSGDPLTVARRLPAAVVCRSVDTAACSTMARAAVAIIPLDWPAIRSVSVWGSLLCDSSIDCPPRLLRSSRPLGSVVLELADAGPTIWINVIESRTLDGSGAPPRTRPDLQAWIVRS